MPSPRCSANKILYCRKVSFVSKCAATQKLVTTNLFLYSNINVVISTELLVVSFAPCVMAKFMFVSNATAMD